MHRIGPGVSNIGINAVLCLVCVLLPGGALFGYSNNIGWLAYGDLRGHIEPCGCDPRTDLGGILRLGGALARDRDLGPGAKVFDLGNNLSEEHQADTKNIYINEALDCFKPDAALVNAVEYRLKSFGRKQRNFVLSNFTSKDALSPPNVQKSGAVSIYGYLWIDGTQKDLRHWQEAFGKGWRARPQQQQAPSYKILLFSGPDEHLREILQKKIFDEVIASNRAPLSALITDEEKLKPGVLMRINSEHVVFQTPLGAQGLLRGGGFRQLRQKPLLELLGTKPVHVMPSVLVSGEELVTWLTPDFAADSPLGRLMERYKKSRGLDFAAIQEKRLAFLEKSPFAGADQCKACHESEWDVWSKAAHRNAYNTLVEKTKHEDPECVSCHVLGFAVDGGFVSLKDSPKFAGVQCENCHGPGAAHAKDQKNKLVVPDKTICSSCHHAPHTAEFNFNVYWPKIRHGKTLRADPGKYP